MTLDDELDFTYIQKWVVEKGVVNIWEALLSKIRYAKGENQKDHLSG